MTETKNTNHPKFDVVVKLTSKDGNAFSILGSVVAGITSAGGTSEDSEAFLAEATSGDYDHLLRTCMKWVNIQ